MSVSMALVQGQKGASMSQPDWIIEMLDRLDADQKEEWEERAAIMELDGGLFRDHAECLALLCILRKHPMALVTEEQRKNDHLI